MPTRINNENVILLQGGYPGGYPGQGQQGGYNPNQGGFPGGQQGGYPGGQQGGYPGQQPQV